MLGTIGLAALDLNDFEPVSDPLRKPSWVITINPRGHIALNNAFQSELIKHTSDLNLGFAIHKTDPRIMRIFLTETPNYTFNKSGSGKNDTDFTRMLVERGITLPARYEISWVEELNSWIAQSNTGLNPNAVKDSINATRKKKV